MPGLDEFDQAQVAYANWEDKMFEQFSKYELIDYIYQLEQRLEVAGLNTQPLVPR